MTLLPMRSFTHALSLVFPDVAFRSRKFYPIFSPPQHPSVGIFALREPLKAPVIVRHA
ncbi:MAG TPA: hypothetical protein VNQ56_00025 [Pseudolabrys sp.]|nr:hypothetical protein [Pseudolabrys sp.]